MPIPTIFPTVAPPVFPPQGVAQFSGYTGGPRQEPPPTSTPDSKAFWWDTADILVRFDTGSMSFDTARCLIEGQASYQMSQDGTWSFDAGTVAQGQCGGDEAGIDFRVLIDTLRNSAHWSFVDNHLGVLPGSYYVIADATTSVYLQVPGADSPDSDGYRDPSPSFGMLAPKPLPGVNQDPAGLMGMWDVVTQEGPYDWQVEITKDRIVLPQGCTTGTGDGYLATADGRWFYGSERDGTADCVIGPLIESGATHVGLFDAANWRIGAICAADGGELPDRVQVDFTDATGRTTLALTRPMRAGENKLPQLTCADTASPAPGVV